MQFQNLQKYTAKSLKPRSLSRNSIYDDVGGGVIRIIAIINVKLTVLNLERVRVTLKLSQLQAKNICEPRGYACDELKDAWCGVHSLEAMLFHRLRTGFGLTRTGSGWVGFAEPAKSPNGLTRTAPGGWVWDTLKPDPNPRGSDPVYGFWRVRVQPVGTRRTRHMLPYILIGDVIH
jgi:hypothetical protein